MKCTLKQIPVVDAADFPLDVEEYCDENDIITHGSHSIVWVDDDENPLAEWLKDQGFEFPEKGYAHIGIFAT